MSNPPRRAIADVLRALRIFFTERVPEDEREFWCYRIDMMLRRVDSTPPEAEHLRWEDLDAVVHLYLSNAEDGEPSWWPGVAQILRGTPSSESSP